LHRKKYQGAEQQVLELLQVAENMLPDRYEKRVWVTHYGIESSCCRVHCWKILVRCEKT